VCVLWVSFPYMPPCVYCRYPFLYPFHCWPVLP